MIMNGCVIPHTPIAVDFWKVRDGPQTIHFLTHLHGDHISGLTSSWDRPIYCSQVTKELLVKKHAVKSELIHALQIGCAEIVFLDHVQQQHMVVTALDANHCPGAVMFLMEGYFGTILHTGDFRFKPEMLTEPTLANLPGNVDVLYVDNTYCSPRCKFPTREQTTTDIIKVIKSHPTHDILIAMRNLGKEDLLVKIAKFFQEYIYVPHKFYETLEILGAPDVFNCENTDLRIQIVPFHTISRSFVEKVNKTRPTIVIMPTALYVGIDARPYEYVDNVYIVPYSDHSSYSELREFVAFLRPGKIIPIVKATSRGPFGMSVADRADMLRFSDLTGEKWNESVKVPLSVQAFMDSRNITTSLGNKRLSRKRQKQSKGHVDSKKIRGVIYESINEEREENNTDCSGSANQEVQDSQKDIVPKVAESCMNIPGKKVSLLAPSNKTEDRNKGSSKKVASDLITKQPKSADCLIGSSQGFEIMNESIGFEKNEAVTPNETLGGTQQNSKESVQSNQKGIFRKTALAVFNTNMESQENQTPIESSNAKGTTDFDQVKAKAKAKKKAAEIRKKEQIIQWIFDTESSVDTPGIDAPVHILNSEGPSIKILHQANGDCESNLKVRDSDHPRSAVKKTDTGVAALEMRNLTAKYICNIVSSRKQKTIKQLDVSNDFPDHSCKSSDKNSNDCESQESENILSVTPASGKSVKKSKVTKYSCAQNLITKCNRTESDVNSSSTPTKVIEQRDNQEQETRSIHVETPNVLQTAVGARRKKMKKSKKTEKKAKDLCNRIEAESENVTVNTHTITSSSHVKVRETEPHSYSSGENFEAANSSGVNPEAANRSGVNPKAANSSGVNHEAANSSDVNHEAVNDTEEGKETGNDFDVNKSGKGKCNVAKSVSTVTKIKSVDNVNSVEFKNACKKTIERYKCPEIKKFIL
ncbi:uncharacterized protein LOC127881765 [Dreissena polymorpha]|uniref:5' exonuclease Apollo n=1 Tax=Dreissena polymorpha TaxID=45954 RepID=A0A9D4GLZ0_DREPO|nr:uncharacterized protein LOC127881765 [Dreissena polymorpha]XP_052285851.1 uncharacterized protein LOC127881765 [Dreissena polymorpha]XP_052285852.1 uncharacterized protein LOC127881765 [Dreissena polymorpha]XP_052285853.1 uncharacterized protein LOC127881765 [Dreissena polymorpha]KAH3819460.1 hypothetical protein DPMN_121196 [Dreissena polymorpha]